MERKLGTSLLGALLLISAGLPVNDAAAASTSGRLTVGITILDTCRINQAAPPPGIGLTIPAGFNLKCTRGTGYTVAVSTRTIQDAHDGPSRVVTTTIDF